MLYLTVEDSYDFGSSVGYAYEFDLVCDREHVEETDGAVKKDG